MYPTLATINASNDISELFIYANELTGGLFMPLFLLTFFIVLFLGGCFAQQFFRGSIRLDFAYAAASFSTFGMAVIMSTRNGLLNITWLILSLVAFILGLVWLYMSNSSND